MHTKGDHIEDLDRLVCSGRRKASSIGADADALDLRGVSAKLLHELDTDCHLLPKLDKAINGRGYEEIGMRSHGDEGQLVLVHERLGVPRRCGQRVYVDLLERELATLLFRCISGREGRSEVIVGR